VYCEPHQEHQRHGRVSHNQKQNQNDLRSSLMLAQDTIGVRLLRGKDREAADDPENDVDLLPNLDGLELHVTLKHTFCWFSQLYRFVNSHNYFRI